MGERHSRGDTWVFGYGSLVAPGSMAATIGRTASAADRRPAHLSGFGRRWNYGSLHLRGDWTHDGVEVRDGLVISLGIALAPEERCNGVVVRVTDEELELLDLRERDYERTDVTDHVNLDPLDLDHDGRRHDARRHDGPQPAGRGLDEPGPVRGRVVTYVPRPSAIERYETARDARRAAIRRSYWELVHLAFDELGGEHPTLLASTPRPDVPVADVRVRRLDDRRAD